MNSWAAQTAPSFAGTWLTGHINATQGLAKPLLLEEVRVYNASCFRMQASNVSGLPCTLQLCNACCIMSLPEISVVLVVVTCTTALHCMHICRCWKSVHASQCHYLTDILTSHHGAAVRQVSATGPILPGCLQCENSHLCRRMLHSFHEIPFLANSQCCDGSAQHAGHLNVPAAVSHANANLCLWHLHRR